MKKILWIEDEADIIKYVISPLKRKGFSFQIAESYEEFNKIKHDTDKFDLILLDLILPKKNSTPPYDYVGLKILDELTNELKTEIPIIVFTVVNNHKTNSKLSKYNIYDILYKPIPSAELTDKIESIINNKISKEY